MIRSSNRIALGCLLLLAHNILTGWQDVHRAVVFRERDVFFLTFLSFVMVAVVFRVVQRSRRAPLTLTRRRLVQLNVSTAGSWGSIFLAISLIPPALAAAIATALGPLCTYLIDRRWRPSARSTWLDGAVCFVAFVITLFLCWATMSGSGEHRDRLALVAGVAFAALTALGDAGTAVAIKVSYDAGASAHEILARRFDLLVVLALAASLVRHTAILTREAVWQAAVVALFGIVPATFLLQKSLRFVQPVLFSLMLATMPAFVLLFQFTNLTMTPTTASVAGIMMVVGLSSFQVIRNLKEDASA